MSKKRNMAEIYRQEEYDKKEKKQWKRSVRPPYMHPKAYEHWKALQNPSKVKHLCIKCMKNQVYPGHNAGPSEKVCSECLP